MSTGPVNTRGVYPALAKGVFCSTYDSLLALGQIPEQSARAISRAMSRSTCIAILCSRSAILRDKSSKSLGMDLADVEEGDDAG